MESVALWTGVFALLSLGGPKNARTKIVKITFFVLFWTLFLGMMFETLFLWTLFCYRLFCVWGPLRARGIFFDFFFGGGAVSTATALQCSLSLYLSISLSPYIQSFHRLLVFLAIFCRQTLSKWLFQILVALFPFSCRKAASPSPLLQLFHLSGDVSSFSHWIFWKVAFSPVAELVEEEGQTLEFQYSQSQLHFQLANDSTFTLKMFNVFKNIFKYFANIPDTNFLHWT